jgi:hypothetical protein
LDGFAGQALAEEREYVPGLVDDVHRRSHLVGHGLDRERLVGANPAEVDRGYGDAESKRGFEAVRAIDENVFDRARRSLDAYQHRDVNFEPSFGDGSQ